MENLIARQPIFEKDLTVFGYKVVYRSAGTSLYLDGDDSKASLSAIRNAFLLLGAKTLTGRKKVFLDFTRTLLVDGVAHSLPSNCVVIDLMQDVEADEAVVLACRRLKEEGYALSLDEPSIKSGAQVELLPFVEFIKGPFIPSDGGSGLNAVRRYLDMGKVVLAEKVETREDYEEARNRGYQLFLGSFFSKPTVIRAKEIPGHKLNYLQVMQEVNRPELNFSEIERVIKQDTSLCYTLLNYVNSAYFGLDTAISSVHHALVLLGEKEVRKWANLVLFTFMGIDKPSELLVTCLVRAKLCESLGLKIGAEDRVAELFLMGMFSILDVLMGRPMAEILKAIHLSKDVEEALLYGTNTFGDVFQTVVNYEMGNWEDFSRSVAKLGIDEAVVPDFYVEAVEWAETVSNLREKSD
jgi:c-di-GMP-related signal transduction protein